MACYVKMSAEWICPVNTTELLPALKVVWWEAQPGGACLHRTRSSQPADTLCCHVVVTHYNMRQYHQGDQYAVQAVFAVTLGDPQNWGFHSTLLCSASFTRWSAQSSWAVAVDLPTNSTEESAVARHLHVTVSQRVGGP
jgi:hypothetical protein